MLSTAILCYMLRVYRSSNSSMDAKHAVNAPVGALVGRATPCRRHRCHCLRWAAPGQLLGARQSARASLPVSSPACWPDSPLSLPRLPSNTPRSLSSPPKHTPVETCCSTPARHPTCPRHPTCARHAACVRQPLDCLCRESLRTPRHMTDPLSPSQPLPSTCAPASIPTHTHTNHTQIIHSIASVITPSISNNTQPDCRHAALIAQSPPHPQPLFAHHLPHCRPTVNPTKLILHRLLHPLLSCQQFGSRILVATPASCWERSLYRRHEQSYSESRSIAPSLSMPSLCSLPTLWPWFTLALPKPPLH
jgi:hypothetical protein